jgi:hypothetical protein
MRAAVLLIGLATLPCACAEALTFGDGFGGTELDAGRESSVLRDASPTPEPDATGVADAKLDSARNVDATSDAEATGDATAADASEPDSGPGPVDSGRPDTGVDAGRPDAGRDAAVDAAGPPPYALGQLCGTAGSMNCPVGWTCTKTDVASVEGFCTRRCNTNADCKQGHSGAGRPECLLVNGAGDEFCAFACTSTCPFANLICSDLDGDFSRDTCTERR